MNEQAPIISEETILKIRKNFTPTSMIFIAEICKLENKKIPEMERMSDYEIRNLYDWENNLVFSKLLNHRRTPLDEAYLSGLSAIETLPRPARILLESITNKTQ